MVFLKRLSVRSYVISLLGLRLRIHLALRGAVQIAVSLEVRA